MNAARWISFLFFLVCPAKIFSMDREKSYHFFNLPKNIQIKICRYLDLNQILTLRSTNKGFWNLLSTIPSVLQRVPVDLKSLCKRNIIYQESLIPPPYEWLPKALTESGKNHLAEECMGSWERHVTGKIIYKKLVHLFNKNKKSKNLVIDLQESLFLIPPEIKKLQSVQTLTLKGAQCVQHLPEEIGDLNKRLRFLSIRQFGIIDLPLSICQLTCLVHLDLSDNRLTNLTTGLWGLASLKTLNLKNNYLTELTSEIGQLDKLEKLILSNNDLSKLPKELGYCYSLAHMDVSCNQISRIPSSLFKHLGKLKRLILDGNYIEALPPSIARCKKLKTISLIHTQFTRFPGELGYLRHLKNIFLDCNPLQGALNQKGFDRIQFLSLRFTKIKPVREIDCFKKLKKIFLDEEMITQYSKEIEQLKTWGIQISL